MTRQTCHISILDDDIPRRLCDATVVQARDPWWTGDNGVFSFTPRQAPSLSHRRSDLPPKPGVLKIVYMCGRCVDVAPDQSFSGPSPITPNLGISYLLAHLPLIWHFTTTYKLKN